MTSWLQMIAFESDAFAVWSIGVAGFVEVVVAAAVGVDRLGTAVEC